MLVLLPYFTISIIFLEWCGLTSDWGELITPLPCGCRKENKVQRCPWCWNHPCWLQQDCFETSGYAIPGPNSSKNFEASESRSGGKYMCACVHTNTHTEGEGGRGKERGIAPEKLPGWGVRRNSVWHCFQMTLLAVIKEGRKKWTTVRKT